MGADGKKWERANGTPFNYVCYFPDSHVLGEVFTRVALTGKIRRQKNTFRNGKITRRRTAAYKTYVGLFRLGNMGVGKNITLRVDDNAGGNGNLIVRELAEKIHHTFRCQSIKCL